MRPVSGRLMNWMVFSDFLLQFVQLFIFGSNGAFEVGDNKQQSETDRDFQIDFSGGKIIGNSKHIPIGAGYPKIGNRIIDVEQIENFETYIHFLEMAQQRILGRPFFANQHFGYSHVDTPVRRHPEYILPPFGMGRQLEAGSRKGGYVHFQDGFPGR